MRQDLVIAPGSQQSGVLNVTNDSTSSVRLRAQLLDFFIDSNMVPQFRRDAPEETPFSCRTWLTLNPMEAEVKPGEQIRIRYTVHVPAGADSRSYHCAAGFSTLPTASESTGTGLQMSVRVVAAFYTIVGSPAVNGGIRNVLVEKQPDGEHGAWQGVVIMENAGKMHFRAVGDLSLLSPEGQVLETVPFVGIPILPARDQRFAFAFRTPLEGKEYLLRARVDIGTSEVQEATVPVAIHARLP